ncbi:MAG: dihydroorotase [Rhodospirillaceae bacterium]|nr:dihydroorotase [Alphaproteobacteria bacterium]MBR73150.1 dihydroorotase [Rhodospirillaceae bacterium]|tara:strand:+ start:3667 stop:4968 length:1302 start_codon:yes stop_codon:yes gene_type:complete
MPNKPDIAYINSRLIDPSSNLDVKGGILTRGSKILDLGSHLFNPDLSEETIMIDCQGHILAPGLVDIHVHLREPGHEHKETIESGGKSAAAGGVTTLCCMPNTNPVIDDVALIEFIQRRAREAKSVKIYPFAAVTKGLEGKQLTEIGMLANAGAVAFTDDGLPIMDSQVMRRALAYAKAFDMIVSQHAEDLSLSGCGCMAEGQMATKLGLPGIPDASEIVIIERDLRLVEITGGRYHVAHISTAQGVEAVRKAKEKGLQVSCEAAPHHFILTDSDVGNYRTFAKMAPPLRSEENRLAIIDGLSDGTIDAIATDHAPHDQESKRVPMEHASNGVVGLETLLSLTLELVNNGHLTLLEALSKITCEPADLIGLKAGKFYKGAPADMVIFDPDAEWTVDLEKIISKSKNTPFEGRKMIGKVNRTIVDGRTVFKQEA